jgi:hypothetical protein
LFHGQVEPLIQSAQGHLVLHASAVDMGGIALAFAADSGRGKSTLAASIARSGYRIITDDALKFMPSYAELVLAPGHPSLRLWSDSASALLATTLPLAPALEHTSKSRFHAGEDLPFCDAATPLRFLYYLGTGGVPDVSIRPLTAGEAVLEIIKHSFILDVDDESRLRSHFAQVSALAAQQIHFALDFPRRYDLLPSVMHALREHSGLGHAT